MGLRDEGQVTVERGEGALGLVLGPGLCLTGGPWPVKLPEKMQQGGFAPKEGRGLSPLSEWGLPEIRGSSPPMGDFLPGNLLKSFYCRNFQTYM